MFRRLLVLGLLATGINSVDAAYTVQSGKIYDDYGRIVQLRGVNWFGAETRIKIVHGLEERNWKDMIQQMKTLDINAIRLPVCPDTLKGSDVSDIDYKLNPDLKGLNSLQVLDKLIREINRQEIYILLDHHRPDCGEVSQLWYTEDYSEREWINDLVFMARRYRNFPFFLGLDIKNEPHGEATRDSGDEKTDWSMAAETAAKAILTTVPDILVFVGGIQKNRKCTGPHPAWWGSSLEPLACSPLDIPPDRLVLSPHVYGPDVHPQPYFNAPNFPNNLPTVWESHFGQFLGHPYAVILGEFGGRYGHGGDPKDRVWQDTLVQYLIEKGVNSGFYWSWNPNSGDTGGLLMDDWKTVWQDKLALLYRLWYQGEPPSALRPSGPACSDEQDNDGDNLVDMQDPGCSSPLDKNEFNPRPGQKTAEDISYKVNNLSDWGKGYCVDVSVTNTRTSPIRWRFSLPVEGSVNSLWNAEYSTQGNEIVVSGKHWNADLGPGETINFGFCADRSTSQQKALPVKPETPPDELKITLKMQSDWGSGYCANILVYNEGDHPVDWQITVRIEGEVNNLWKANHVQEGDRLTAEGLGHNNIVSPGAQVDFGFCATR